LQAQITELEKGLEMAGQENQNIRTSLEEKIKGLDQELNE